MDGTSKKELSALNLINAEIEKGITPAKALGNQWSNLSQNNQYLLRGLVKSGKPLNEVSQGFLDAAKNANKMSFASKAAAIGMQALNIAASMGIMALVSLAVKGIEYVINYSDHVTEAAQKAGEALEKTTDEIKSLNEEFKVNNDRITVLESKGNLTFVEKDELGKLKSINKELEVTIANLKLKEDIEQTEYIEKSAKASKAGDNDSWKRKNHNVQNDSEYVQSTLADWVKNEPRSSNYDSDIEYFKAILEDTKVGTDAFKEASADLQKEIDQLKTNIGTNTYKQGNNISEAQKEINNQIDILVQAQAKLQVANGDVSAAIANVLSNGKFKSIGDNILSGKEIDKSSESWKELESVLTTLGIPTDNIIASFTELSNKTNEVSEGVDEAADSLSDFANEAKKATESITTLADKESLLKNIGEQIKKFGAIDSGNLSSIYDTFKDNDKVMNALNDYVAGMGTVNDLYRELKSAYNSDKQSYIDATMQKLYTDSDFLEKVISNNVTLRNDLAGLYNGDLTNYSKLAQAKLSLDTNLITVLGSNWQKYYKSQGEAIRRAIMFTKAGLQDDGIRAIKGTERSPEEIAADKALLAELEKQVALADYYDKIAEQTTGFTKKLNTTLNTITGISSADKEDKKDYWKEAFDNELKYLKYLLDKKKISQEDYYNSLEALNRKYFQNNAKYIDEFRQYDVEVFEGRIKLLEEAEKKIRDLIDLRIDYIKKQKELQKEAIDEEIKSKKKIIDLQKEAIALQKEERDYAKELAEKQKSVTDIQAELISLDLDNSAEATKRKLELKEDLAKRQGDLDDFVYDNSVEKEQEALDKEYEAFETEKQKELDKIQEFLDNAQALREQAMNDLNGMHQNVLNELIEHNRLYGDGVTENITKAWADAYDALKRYGDLNNIINSLNGIDNQQKNNEYNGGSSAPPASGGGSSGSSGGLNVGDRVKSIGTGNGASDGSSISAKRGLSNRTIMRIKEGARYPYLIGVNGVPTGWYTASALQRYHTGGEIGRNKTALAKTFAKYLNLKNDEIPIIAQKGEVMVTRPQMTNLVDRVIPSLANMRNVNGFHATFGNIIVKGNVDKDILQELKHIPRQWEKELMEKWEKSQRYSGYNPNRKYTG